MNLTDYPYASQRRVILGKRGAVATSQPLASLAGMEMFWRGGNAVDAAVATAIALTVVEPTSNGIGADAFALVWDGNLHGLNASGKSPAAMTLDKYSNLCSVPRTGWLTVTIPGAVSAWRSLWQRWGKLPFEELFAPAIRYAEEGFPVSPVTAMAWKQAEKVYLPLTGREFQQFKEVFFPGDRAPQAGEIWGSIIHAETLRAIAFSGGESFYSGEIAEKIANFAANTNGLIAKSDLANHQADWVNPISTQYRHLRVWEIPPNTQGIATLMALNILENFNINKHSRESVESYHQQIEAMKLAFADVNNYVADPKFMNVTCEELLAKSYANKRQKLIQEQAISVAEPGIFKGGTVYLCAADENLMVSLIQSNYDGFGSGILIPGTGIALQNRASGFTLEPEHPNQLAPEKRPFHTIIPGFITQENEPLATFGVMGGQMQPQGHLQVVVNLADYNLNPQGALDAPRWRFIADKQVLLEANVPEFIAHGLRDKGHNVTLTKTREMFGRGQIIWRQKDVLIAASEPRADGLAIAW
ncbi:gamma-glutamyltransferase family protein [Oscillatoria salina]|uniref:gamma-glutamyltransferase family protein n=1 Tax=Oscillatoria salina TaxID=331517 RepID=UPI001CCCDB6A|nr:gamma-glutamyltransferase family protein [Oscillatoria salina]MBZ8179999.1 gamma-glutamyltransferase family protein [Oscillatoria salina IIICB1]